VGALAEVSFDDSDPRNVCRDGRAAYAEMAGPTRSSTAIPSTTLLRSKELTRASRDVFDEYGNVERVVTRYPDGRSVTERLAYGKPSPAGGERFPAARGRNMSREEMDGLLSLLPPLPGTSRKTELGLYRGRHRPGDEAASAPAHPWGQHWKERDDGFARTTLPAASPGDGGRVGASRREAAR